MVEQHMPQYFNIFNKTVSDIEILKMSKNMLIISNICVILSNV